MASRERYSALARGKEGRPRKYQIQALSVSRNLNRRIYSQDILQPNRTAPQARGSLMVDPIDHRLSVAASRFAVPWGGPGLLEVIQREPVCRIKAQRFLKLPRRFIRLA